MFREPKQETPLPEQPRRTFRQVLWRVMAVQVIALALLALLQARYGR